MNEKTNNNELLSNKKVEFRKKIISFKNCDLMKNVTGAAELI